jgi:hypothetical protein
MRSLGNRLEDMERKVEAIKPAMVVRTFTIEGATPGMDTVVFLRSQGHDIGPDDFCIIRSVVGWKDGKPDPVPLRDITHEYG